MHIGFLRFVNTYDTNNHAFIYTQPESIKWYIAGQAFSRSNDLVPPSPPPPLSSENSVNTQEDGERETTCWREKGEEVGKDDGDRAWFIYKHSILSRHSHLKTNAFVSAFKHSLHVPSKYVSFLFSLTLYYRDHREFVLFFSKLLS